MNVKGIMSTRLITVTPEENVTSAVKRMTEHDISGMIVVKAGSGIGVITMRDIFRKVLSCDLDPNSTLVSQVMSQPLITVHELREIEAAAKSMRSRKVRRLGVVNSANKLTGIITAMDIVSHLPEYIKLMFETWVRPGWR
ncbi:CBS domain-containing protein [Candidatus Altiarchaeota archaeon]